MLRLALCNDHLRKKSRPLWGGFSAQDMAAFCGRLSTQRQSSYGSALVFRSRQALLQTSPQG